MTRSLVAASLAALFLVSAPPRAAAVRADLLSPVFRTDFESGMPPEISAPGATLVPVQGWNGLGHPGLEFGGQFLRYAATELQDTRLVLRQLPPHTHLDLVFLLAVIDSWDGTELFQVRVDGALRWSHWFQLALGDTSSYAPAPGALLRSGSELGFSLGSYYSRDRAYDLGRDPAFQLIPHTADTLEVVWSLGAVSGNAAQNWQGGDDESWAIDAVHVFLYPAGTGDAPPAHENESLALRAPSPNPTRGPRVAFSCTLGAHEPALLELFDIGGRRVAARRLDAPLAGMQRVDLEIGSRRAAGLHLARLTQGREQRTARVVIVP